MEYHDAINELMGLWLGPSDDGFTQNINLVKQRYPGTLETWAPLSVANTLHEAPATVVEDNAFVTVCGGQLKAHHFLYHKVERGRPMVFEQYAARGEGFV